MPVDLDQTERQPDPITVAQWAIAASRLGKSLQVIFQDYPLPLIRDLFRMFAYWVQPSHVCEIYNTTDFRRLSTTIGSTFLVLLFEPRLYIKTAWLVAMAKNDNLQTRPAIFSC